MHKESIQMYRRLRRRTRVMASWNVVDRDDQGIPILCSSIVSLLVVIICAGPQQWLRQTYKASSPWDAYNLTVLSLTSSTRVGSIDSAAFLQRWWLLAHDEIHSEASVRAHLDAVSPVVRILIGIAFHDERPSSWNQHQNRQYCLFYDYAMNGIQTETNENLP